MTPKKRKTKPKPKFKATSKPRKRSNIQQARALAKSATIFEKIVCNALVDIRKQLDFVGDNASLQNRLVAMRMEIDRLKVDKTGLIAEYSRDRADLLKRIAQLEASQGSLQTMFRNYRQDELRAGSLP